MPTSIDSRCSVSIPFGATGEDSELCGADNTQVCENCGVICPSCAETFPCPLVSEGKHVFLAPQQLTSNPTPTPKPRKPILTPIVKRAMVHTITDIGQLSHDELRELNYAVKHGALAKAKGGPFPILKTVYAVPGFDFAQDRENAIAEMRRAAMIDIARGTDKFFPLVTFQKVAGGQ